MGLSKKAFYSCMVVLPLVIMSVAHAAEVKQAKADTAKSGLGEKYDTSLPVEISSDNLEVFQHENKAIFKGNVIAVQGKVRLKSDTMIVHYKQQDGANKGATKPTPAPGKPEGASSAQDKGEMGAITLIEVEGNVFMATPEESAKGDKGNYQVPEKLLHLTGDNVTLTRDKNILRGTELVYDLESGHSVLTNHGAKVDSRVRGVFVPNQDKDKGKGKAKDKDKEKTASPSTAAPAPAIALPDASVPVTAVPAAIAAPAQ